MSDRRPKSQAACRGDTVSHDGQEDGQQKS